nr:uncharacterized protein LOC109184133 isoform X2 [Ipomoea trifida]
MEQQMGESSGVKSPVFGPDMDHMSTSPVDQTEELLEAYAALEIEDDGTDEQVQRRSEDITLMLVGKLISDKLAKFAFMRDTMAVEDLGNNIFIFQFFHVRDMQRILDDGPWAYEQSLLVLVKMRLDTPPMALPFNRAEFWIQLHDLPYGFYSEKTAMATNRRSSPATGRRWLVLDQERSGGNPPVQRSGSGTEHSVPVTVPGTPHSQNIPQCTVPSRDERVSTVHMVGGEGTKVAANLSGGGVVDSTDCDGLTIVDQKRRRVDDASSVIVSKSDHLPLFLEIHPTTPIPQKARFRFENLWLRDSTSKDIMTESWSMSGGLHLIDRMERCSKAIWNWGKSFAKDFDKRLSYWRKRMESTKSRRDPMGISTFQEAQAQYIRALHHQNDYWRQRAKQFWLREGDTNSAYFHNSVRRRRQNNRISKLKDEDGNWVERGYLRDAKVENLLNVERTNWDAELLNDIFEQEDIVPNIGHR